MGEIAPQGLIRHLASPSYASIPQSRAIFHRTNSRYSGSFSTSSCHGTATFLRRSISRGSSNRKSQARALSTRVSEFTLCPLGQSKKAIGQESPIGPCIATHRVGNRQACCFRKRWAPSQQRNGTTGTKNGFSASHAETNHDLRT